MFEWAQRETLLDVSINAFPVTLLVLFDLLFLLVSPWGADPLAETLTHALTLFPLVVLAFATYQVARAVERDAAA